MNNIKVSVVVPVYNQENYLRDALDSLKAQTLEEIEFIIINDGSTDASIEIIKEYAADDDRFIVVDKENGGVAVAINTGNQMARGEYLAELDSDDYVASDMYEKMYAIAKEHDLDILKSNVINFTGTGDTFVGKTEKIAKSDYFDRVINPQEDKVVFSFPMYAWVSLYRRELIIDNHIVWNEGVSSYNDNGFYWQTMGLSNRVMYIDEDFIYHRRDNEMSTVKNPDKMFNNFFIEHKFIKDNLKSRGLFEEVKAFFFERKINNYFFALNIIPFEKKQEFFSLIAEDFKKDIEEDGLNECEFVNNNNKLKINEIVNDPNQYFYQVYVNEFYKVSVVVPIHNAAPFLRNTLDNLVNQSLRQIEIILVENGSTDNTVEIINEYANKDPRIVAVSIGQSNAGHARNVGLSMAHGKYIIFLDADDEYSRDLLKKSFEVGQRKNADVVWFNTQEKNAKNGLYKPHQSYAFNKAQMPNKQPFSFSEIKGNPYSAFIGWPWDKMFKLKFIQGNDFKYQELEVSNDGYFNFLAMSAARRIATISEILVTRVVEHGSNISATKHDKNHDNQFNMILAIYEKLKKMPDGERNATKWAIRNIKSISWAFTTGFKTLEGASKYFDLLVDGGLERLEIEKLEPEWFGKDERVIFEKLLKLKEYKKGEYLKFIEEVGGEEFTIKPSSSVIRYWPDPKRQDKTGRLIFGHSEDAGRGKVLPWFNIIISNNDTSNVSAIIDFTYMGNFKSVVKDTLNLSFSIQEVEGELQSIVHQAEWDKGEQVFIDNIYYVLVDNVLTVYAKYVDQYTGFEYAFNTISSREGRIMFSVIRSNVGYTEKLPIEQTDDMLKISTVAADFTSPIVTGNRTVFRESSETGTGQDLFAVNLKRYPFNNVVLAVNIVKVPNNKPAVYDTLYLGFNLKNDENLTGNVFQAEWLYGRKGLRNHIYYYIDNNKLYVGAKSMDQYTGYNFEIVSVMGREAEKDYHISKLAPELIEYEAVKIPEAAQFVNKTVEK